MTRAPCVAAISRVPSVEPASTTSTSVTRDAGISSRTRAIEPASLYVGMTTLTRIPKGLSEAPTWMAARDQGVHTPGASRTRIGQTKCDDHRYAQLPNPRGAQLRYPQTQKERSGSCGNDAGRGARQQQHAEPELGRGLQRRDDARVVRHHGNQRLPDGG